MARMSTWTVLAYTQVALQILVCIGIAFASCTLAVVLPGSIDNKVYFTLIAVMPSAAYFITFPLSMSKIYAMKRAKETLATAVAIRTLTNCYNSKLLPKHFGYKPPTGVSSIKTIYLFNSVVSGIALLGGICAS